MPPELLVRMFTDIDNLTMVKESTGDLSRMQRIAELTGGALPFYNGSNPLVLQALTVGAAGWCTAAPNLRPQRCLDLYAAVRAGDLEQAQVIYDDLAPLLRFIVDGGLPTTVKAGLDLLGHGVGDPRRPLLPLGRPGEPICRSCWQPSIGSSTLWASGGCQRQPPGHELPPEHGRQR